MSYKSVRIISFLGVISIHTKPSPYSSCYQDTLAMNLFFRIHFVLLDVCWNCDLDKKPSGVRCRRQNGFFIVWPCLSTKGVNFGLNLI